MTLILILLVVLIIAGAPNWGFHTAGWGPSGVGSVILLLLVLWLFFGNGHTHFR